MFINLFFFIALLNSPIVYSLYLQPIEMIEWSNCIALAHALYWISSLLAPTEKYPLSIDILWSAHLANIDMILSDPCPNFQ